MNVNLIPLNAWIEQQYKSYPDTSKREQKEYEAENLGVSVTTIYNWLRNGNVYIELVSNGDDGPSAVIWEMKKVCDN